MRKQQLTLNIMITHLVLVNKGKEGGIEGAALYAKLENTGVEAIKELEVIVDNLRCQIKNERTNRWKSW
eukprot:11256333-Heterocapsa_arctica.AAC.1